MGGSREKLTVLDDGTQRQSERRNAEDDADRSEAWESTFIEHEMEENRNRLTDSKLSDGMATQDVECRKTPTRHEPFAGARCYERMCVDSWCRA